MKRKILEPVWGDEKKTHVLCKFRYEDGTVVHASVSPHNDNPDWKEIMEIFGPEYIDRQLNIKHQIVKRNKSKEEEHRKRQEELFMKEQLFRAKSEAFDIEIIKNSKNRDLKNKIRRAKNALEVKIYATALCMKEDPALNSGV
jgi:hypothetical protein